MPARRVAVALSLVVASIALAGCGGGSDEGATNETETTTQTATPAGSTLQASVGPGFDISLTMENGDEIAALKAGEYTIEVDDQSSSHNFHLTGPGVDEDSGVSETGKTTWTVTFEPGSYHYQCDPHASQMNGDFEVAS